MFKSINELDRFSFEDCVFCELSEAEDGLVFELEALIVRANNSQNANFTDSYAGTSFMKLSNAVITKVFKAGYKYYDADGKLLKSVEDTPIAKGEWKALFKLMQGSYLCAVEKTDKGYLLEIELYEEDGAGDSYLLEVECTDATVTWERYMNRVQR